MSQDFAGRRVLLQDAGGRSHQLLAETLTRHGLEVTAGVAFADLQGQVAKRARSGAPFELVILDLAELPPEEVRIGLEGIASAAGGTAVLLAFGYPGQRTRVQQSGVNPMPVFLHRPLKEAQMRAVLRRALRVPDQEPGPAPVSGPPNPPASRKGRILLVEDHRINQKVVVSILSSAGYEVEVATTGVEALEALARSAYGAVIMDCHMPEMDGFEATALLRSREDPNHRTPVIALTANTMQGDREKCLAAGMDDFLGKPFRREAMLATLAKWM